MKQEFACLPQLVEQYKARDGDPLTKMIDYFKGIASLEEAIRRAVLAISADGKKYGHQW